MVLTSNYKTSSMIQEFHEYVCGREKEMREIDREKERVEKAKERIRVREKEKGRSEGNERERVREPVKRE